MTQTACFTFFLSLNDFLSLKNRNKSVNYTFTGNPAVKDAIEAIGIPHTEVDIIVVNGSPVNFFYKLQNNDTAAVYPVNATPAHTKNYSLTPAFIYPLRFIADVQLGKLARGLRLLGVDTSYQNDYSDRLIVEIAEKEERIVLTRDIGLLKHKSIKCGYWLRSQMVEKQLEEVVTRFDLSTNTALFERCLVCNGKIEAVSKETVLKKLPPKTIEYFNEFFQCSSCKKVYWKGSHYKNMLEIVKRNVEKY